MTNTEMLEKFKLEGYPVVEGMTQVEMRAVKKSFSNEAVKETGLVVMIKNGKEFKVQSQDVDSCLASGMARK